MHDRGAQGALYSEAKMELHGVEGNSGWGCDEGSKAQITTLFGSILFNHEQKHDVFSTSI